MKEGGNDLTRLTSSATTCSGQWGCAVHCAMVWRGITTPRDLYRAVLASRPEQEQMNEQQGSKVVTKQLGLHYTNICYRKTKNTPPTNYCIISLPLVLRAGYEQPQRQSISESKACTRLQDGSAQLLDHPAQGSLQHIFRLLLLFPRTPPFSELAPPFTVVNLVEKLGSPRLSRPKLLNVSRTIVTTWRIHYGCLHNLI